MYTIKVLNDTQFDKLPFKHAKDALGCADKSTMTAYIRKTQYGRISNIINAATMYHELDELIMKTSPHEIDGIRYKSGRDFASNIVKTVGGIFSVAYPILSPLIGAATGALGSVIKKQPGDILSKMAGGAIKNVGYASGNVLYSALGGGVGDVVESKMQGDKITGGSILKSAATGAGASSGLSALSSGGSALLSASGQGATAGESLKAGAKGVFLGNPATGAANTQTGLNAKSATSYTGLASPGVAGTNATSTVDPFIGPLNPVTSGLTGPTSALQSGGTAATKGLLGSGGQFNAGLQSILGSGKDTLNIGGGGTMGGAFKAGAQTVGTMAKEQLMNPMTLMGLGSMAMGSMPIDVKAPNIGEITAKWLTADSVTRAGAAARGALDDTIIGDFTVSKETMGLVDTLHKDIDKQFKTRHEQLDKMGLASNSQWMHSGERLEAHMKLDEESSFNKDRVSSELTANAQQQHARERFNAVMQDLQADEATKRDLLYGELSEVLLTHGVEREDLLNFRKIAADAGMYLVGRGTGLI